MQVGFETLLVFFHLFLGDLGACLEFPADTSWIKVAHGILHHFGELEITLRATVALDPILCKRPCMPAVRYHAVYKRHTHTHTSCTHARTHACTHARTYAHCNSVLIEIWNLLGRTSLLLPLWRLLQLSWELMVHTTYERGQEGKPKGACEQMRADMLSSVCTLVEQLTLRVIYQ